MADSKEHPFLINGVYYDSLFVDESIDSIKRHLSVGWMEFQDVAFRKIKYFCGSSMRDIWVAEIPTYQLKEIMEYRDSVSRVKSKQEVLDEANNKS